MKKVFKAIVALCAALCVSMGVISCSKIKGQSKVEKAVVTISISGVNHTFNFDIYLNYAPGTIEHFKELATKGYYNGSVISNVSGHVEFGAYKLDENGKYVSKLSDYSKIISASYMSGKYLYYGDDKKEMVNYPRYKAGSIVGEFAYNGYTGNNLGFDGALVLKRDIDTEVSANAYNTGKGAMAVTFGNGDYYFNSPSEFAIIGMISKEDGDATTSSYARLKEIMSEYAETTEGNVYYYYTLGTEDYYAELDAEYAEKFADGEIEVDPEIINYGHYFMLDAEEVCYRWDSNGDGKVDFQDEALEDDAEVVGDAAEILINELSENSVYLNTIPYDGVVIKIVSITFSK